MFISTLELFKIGVGPSSSHTMGPMAAAVDFRTRILRQCKETSTEDNTSIKVILKGSLAYTGKGHATDRAVILGLHGFTPSALISCDIDELHQKLLTHRHVEIGNKRVCFDPNLDVEFNRGTPLQEHPNGMIFQLFSGERLALEERYFSIGGGFILTQEEIRADEVPLELAHHPFPFDSASAMLAMASESGLSISEMKRANETQALSNDALNDALDGLWGAMKSCIETGLACTGELPGGLNVSRRAKSLCDLCHSSDDTTINDWLCAYAMAVNEENAAGHMVVTAPTNGAAGVVPAVLYYAVKHRNFGIEKVRDYLLTAAAIGGIIKHRSSISGAEVGCQGEVGSAAAMAAAGLCAMLGGTPQHIENAAEIALEHHLGMTCDPVAGLVQIPCIERNGFGAIKAYTAATLAKRGSGQHFMPLDNCIAAMKQTGLEMSEKYKETSLGGLAVNLTEC